MDQEFKARMLKAIESVKQIMANQRIVIQMERSLKEINNLIERLRQDIEQLEKNKNGKRN